MRAADHGPGDEDSPTRQRGRGDAIVAPGWIIVAWLGDWPLLPIPAVVRRRGRRRPGELSVVHPARRGRSAGNTAKTRRALGHPGDNAACR